MTLGKMILTASACLSLFTCSSGLARAQDITDSFGALGNAVKLGSTVIVSDVDGHRVKGKLTNLSASSVSLNVSGHEKVFPAERVREITEQRRYTRRGAGIGFLTGVALVLVEESVSDDEACTNSSQGICSTGVSVAMGAVAGGFFAAIGAGIGAGITHERPVYRAPASTPSKSLTVAPFASKRGTGFRLAYRF